MTRRTRLNEKEWVYMKMVVINSDCCELVQPEGELHDQKNCMVCKLIVRLEN